MNNKPILLLGGGGHAAILLEVLAEQKREVIGVFAPEIDQRHSIFFNYQIYENDEQIIKFDPNNVLLINGIGSFPGNNIRLKIFNKFSKMNYRFESVVSPQAFISPSAFLAEGVQVMAGAILQAGAKIGCNTIINTGATVDHDCSIGMNNHIAPGVTLCGGVTTGDDIHVGTGAIIIQNIDIGDCSIIGAGAIITKNVNKNSKVYGYKSAIDSKSGLNDEL